MRSIEFLTKPYPPGVREDLLRLSQGQGGGEGGGREGEEKKGVVADVCLYNFLLGHLFAEAAQDVVAKAGHSMDDIAIIGSHGYIVKCSGIVLDHHYTCSQTDNPALTPASHPPRLQSVLHSSDRRASCHCQ